MRKIYLIILFTLSASLVQAQITIGGGVFGGARKADVGGSTCVHIGGEGTACDIIINAVYGGNDISGHIGASDMVPADMNHAAECGLTTAEEGEDKGKNKKGYNAFVRTSKEGSGKHIFIGKLFGGGYGNYQYTDDGQGTYTVTPHSAEGDGDTEGEEEPLATGATIPNLAKTYMELCGGTFGYVFGGGDSVTVTQAADIYIHNESTDITKASTSTENDDDEGVIVKSDRLKEMGINTAYYNNTFHFSRIFGGNNKADMAIRPTWHLEKGRIESLYSGGNEGRMTNKEGLLLEINPKEENAAALIINNVYGGCRRADVRPLDDTGADVVSENDIQLHDAEGHQIYNFPAGLAARVLVRGGDITNVYGGNDVSGRVYGGNVVGIYSSIRGDVYGGGNGSYPYTDNPKLKESLLYGDFYYDIPSGVSSAEALNDFRPNAEQVSVRLSGRVTEAGSGETTIIPTIIGGSVYVGGNSATLKTVKNSPKVELKVGSHVIADQVFLGNNGANMVKSQTEDDVLQIMASTDKTSDGSKFNSMTLTDPATFATYMDGAAMNLIPTIVFDDQEKGDPSTYQDYTTWFGSFYCGGNVGSMTYSGTNTMNLIRRIYTYDKIVAGCNNANVAKTPYNAAYQGGVTVAPASGQKKLVLNFEGTELRPMRWKLNNDGTRYVNPTTGLPELEWNTKKWVTHTNTSSTLENVSVPTGSTLDKDIRLVGGNVYGGCYQSGHVNGGVEMNFNSNLINKENLFAVLNEDGTAVVKQNSGVVLHEQGMDVLVSALSVFGGGYGAGTEIWGSTTINLNKGYVFQVFGGGEQGAIGQKDGEGHYAYDPTFSTYIHLKGEPTGDVEGSANDGDMAECEFIYGGGFEGPIAGDTHVYLGNGRLFNSFAGSCNADIYGHTETYVGRNSASENDFGFPYVRDHIYGGNDLGGSILGTRNFKENIHSELQPLVYNPQDETDPAVTNASAYVEYIQGHVAYIFGGCYGDYDYGEGYDISQKPRLENAFVNFKPRHNNNPLNGVQRIYGAGQGHLHETGHQHYKDCMQDRSYVLIEIPSTVQESTFENLAVFGAGANCGLGMNLPKTSVAANPDIASAVVDLLAGKIGNAYGGSYEEGFTRRTVINVPSGATINVKNIFGGAYGADPLVPCDVYEAQVNYHSEDASVRECIYGGNNNADRTLYGQVNITANVWKNKRATSDRERWATVFGAGYGLDTWSQYTEVNLKRGATVYEVYGGGSRGQVINKESLLKWQAEDPTLDLSMGDYEENGLDNDLAHMSGVGSALEGKYNTNVHIKEGATVRNYAYGGGLGDSKATVSGGDVYGTTYIDLLGGTVRKDIFAAGTTGNVMDGKGVTAAGFGEGENHVGGFVASANAYIEGGTVRNVYGGGWEGGVGKHTGSIDADPDGDILGETHVVIGKQDGDSFVNGIPAVERNAYGGGEGGAVYGTTHLILNKGYVGYRYFAQEPEDETLVCHHEGGGYYQEKIPDETSQTYPQKQDQLEMSGNLFGGGYIDNSSVDFTDVVMYGGIVRGSVFGGGEIAAVGRGKVKMTGEANSVRTLEGIYKPGRTHVEIYGGQVLRHVFGGGRGYDNLNRIGTLYSDGFVFGSTDVHIRGGEIGTVEGLSRGFGNVFGGGDIGYVYSGTGKKVGERESDDQLTNGMPTNGGGYYYIDGDKTKGMTTDCNVDVAAYCRVTAAEGVTIDGKTFAQGEYVPVEYLNKLQRYTSDNSNGKPIWDKLNADGIKIHNAIFAGGNVSSGSDQVYANAVTVYGNVTAALRDVYNRDLIEVGTEHTGGLYGDGNLTFVDGFRDLHIDNYGTDYYGLDKEITKAEYDGLSDRERAYFVLKYKCKTTCIDRQGKEYTSTSDPLTADEIRELFAVISGVDTNPTWTTGAWDAENHKPSADYWDESGFCSLYAGRLLNTIQRADMVAIFGSRMVLQGARDRVPEKADYTNYTINRVDEVSLNKRESQANDTDAKDQVHGNYFGIYNIVNYLGNLTSDVFFTEAADHPSAIRTTDTDKESNKADGTTTYYQWKFANRQKSNRNNATSHNKVALASGVYLEIIREETEKTGETKWGLITGVVELDLIDVRQGFGGGYVYAKNEHRPKVWHPDYGKVTISPYNTAARTYRRFVYTGTEVEIETSGNFVHNTKQIIDDCYPNANSYKGADAAPAHYWYIKGSIYVYDQYISAYTGSANAYSEVVNMPFTISASSHGKLTLRDVQPNLYAYYGENGPLGAEGKVVVGNVTYRAGDPIDYWTWNTLSAADQSRFVPEVYTVIADCKIGNTEYKEGDILLPNAVVSLRGTTPPTITYVEDGVEKADKSFDFFFRQANNLGHNTGYVLTCDLNNPGLWNDYFSLTNGRDAQGKLSITTDAYNELSDADKARYTEGPTYTPVSSGVYGQRFYNYGEIITKSVYDTYGALTPEQLQGLTNQQAEVERAYVVTTELTVTNKSGREQHLYPGASVYESDYAGDVWAALKDGTNPKVAAAKVCTNTLQLAETEYIYAGNLLSQAEIGRLKERYTELTDDLLSQHLTEAYICTSEQGGYYGGNYYQAGKSYRAINAWCSMSADDRKNFCYNYDGLDLLIDPSYGGTYGFMPQYDGYKPNLTKTVINSATDVASLAQHEGSIPLKPIVYSEQQPIDYEAEYTGTSPLTYTGPNGPVTIQPGYENRIKRLAYEAIPNEKVHWSPLVVTEPGNYYIVKDPFINGDFPYTPGQVLTEDQYNSLGDKKEYIDVINIDDYHAGPMVDDKRQPVTYYFCREEYTIGEHGEGQGFRTLGIKEGTTPTLYNNGQPVPRAVLINQTDYSKLVNKQVGFIIHGNAPIETSTFYVNRESDIFDLQKEKIITVIFLYEYQESDESGNNITPVSERHILNIHIQFESGVPEIGELSDPSVVLPGSTIGLQIPRVEPGAFEITSSGWEIFTNGTDAERHQNGQPYYNNATPMYWYQNGYWVAYYAQTYLGKTYSNAVQFNVANYHDIKKVMEDRENHYYIDHPDAIKERGPKIYINDYTAGGENGLDIFKDLIDLTYGNKPTVPTGETEHTALADELKGGDNLEFILRTDIEHPDSWTPIADNPGECFGGTFHGDGYTISGLNHSLFNHLCGDVYNLGVTGTFTGAGIAEDGKGYVENCWISTSSAEEKPAPPVFGSPEVEAGTSRPVRIVNCYYQEEDDAANPYPSHTGTYGSPIRKPQQSFYNGEVAYNLNGFYLNKRYYDHNQSSLDAPAVRYGFLTEGMDAENNPVLEVKESKYGSDYSRYVYVENRFKYDDFIYAGGFIPEGVNVRQRMENEEVVYLPIWPDDYIYFGQRLNYGHDDTYEHQTHPSHIIKMSDDRLLTSAEGNRVYRAPAYFRSGQMQVAHFNPQAVFAQTKKGDGSVLAYKNMTAIDFTGHGETTSYKKGLVTEGIYQHVGQGKGAFYPPLLDDAGLTGFLNADLTQNLLAYAPKETENAHTFGVLDDYFDDLTCVEASSPADYRKIAAVSASDRENVRGHVVFQTDDGYVADRDHFLVDFNDFNAPIAYDFASGKRMWYQRTPSRYVDAASGWDAVSLPFTAELVTTQDKGELTHFYGQSLTGHEYWLRGYRDITGVNSEDQATAIFRYPDAVAGHDKSYTNTFLWDYYYENAAGHNLHDENTDLYQQGYYRQSHTYENYPLLGAATPYLVGFPGVRYYEFDLSGTFVARHTASGTPERLAAQTVTFASEPAASIDVSDDELAESARQNTKNGYVFTPNYLNTTLPVGSYTLDAAGSSYEKITDESTSEQKALSPFRPYFAKVKTTGGAAPRHIVFSNEQSVMGGEHEEDEGLGADGRLAIYTQGRNIVVESTLSQDTPVSITNSAGITFASFTIQPGETIETPVPMTGVYILRAAGGRYNKKVSVK